MDAFPSDLPMGQPMRGHIMDLQSPSPTPNQTGRYRRNGKLQSCEPCRKSKLRCDHVVPACGRCIRRRCVDQCVYHPNPLTQTRKSPKISFPTPSSTNHEVTPSIVQSIEASIEATYVLSPEISELERTSPVAPAEVAIQFHRAASAPPLHTRRESQLQGTGFLGATSYSSIFNDGLGNLGLQTLDVEVTNVKCQNPNVPHERIVRGAKILEFLKDQHMIQCFLECGFEESGGSGAVCPQSIVMEWIKDLGAQYSDVLKEQNPEKMRQLSELVWRNTAVPLVFDGRTTALEYAHSASGRKIRWEVIGLIAALLGLASSNLEPSHALLSQHKVARMAFTRQMSCIALACIGFCRDFDSFDDLFVWLLMENWCLLTVLKGDGGYAAYSAGGEVISAVVAMGLHQQVKAGDQVPLFLAELRKRMLNNTYACEIGTAAFLGRPPRLSKRYCNMAVPLDLGDWRSARDLAEIDQKVAGLDAAGYNRTGKIGHVTFEKAWNGFACVREDILDLALGNYDRDKILRAAADIERQTEEYWQSLPPFLQRLRETDTVDFSTGPVQALYQVMLRQGTRANSLLLQRVLIRKTGASSDELIRIARAVFKDVLMVTARHEIADNHQMDMVGLLAVHGLRSAAVIAVELLKQEQLPVYPSQPLLPRSETIQELSVFAARLAAVDPTEGSFSICNQGRKVITRILDKILAPPNTADRMRHIQAATTTTSTLPDEQQQQQQLQGGVVGQLEEATFLLNHGLQQNGGGPYQHQGLDLAAIDDITLGLEAPFLAHDRDFMQWLETMDWQPPDPWSSGA